MASIRSVREGFDKFPTPVKIIFYSGLSMIVAKLIGDIKSLDTMLGDYLVIVLGVVTNLIAWLVLELREDGE